MKGDIIYALQTLCVLLTISEYGSQIWKTYKTKKVEDLSFGYWICKNTINILQIAILIVSGNPLKVFLSQMIGLFGAFAIFTMMIYYYKQSNKNVE